MKKKEYLYETIHNQLTYVKTSGPDSIYYCPFCEVRYGKPDNKGCLYINYTKEDAYGLGKAHCFKCHFKLSEIEPLIKILTGEEAIQFSDKDWVDKVSVYLSADVESSDVMDLEATVELPEGFKLLSIPPKSRIAKRIYLYLQKRGLTDLNIIRLGIGYTNKMAKYKDHAIFPLYQGTKLRFWTTRCCRKELREWVDHHTGRTRCEVKSWHPPAACKDVLFNYNEARLQKVVYIAEGPFSALAFKKKGVAILGGAMSAGQIALLGRMRAEEFCVVFDAGCEEIIVETAQRIQEALDVRVSYIFLKKGDPDDNRLKLKKYIKRRSYLGADDALNQAMHILGGV